MNARRSARAGCRKLIAAPPSFLPLFDDVTGSMTSFPGALPGPPSNGCSAAVPPDMIRVDNYALR